MRCGVLHGVGDRQASVTDEERPLREPLAIDHRLDAFNFALGAHPGSRQLHALGAGMGDVDLGAGGGVLGHRVVAAALVADAVAIDRQAASRRATSLDAP
jgi:hypothetical protein